MKSYEQDHRTANIRATKFRSLNVESYHSQDTDDKCRANLGQTQYHNDNNNNHDHHSNTKNSESSARDNKGRDSVLAVSFNQVSFSVKSTKQQQSNPLANILNLVIPNFCSINKQQEPEINNKQQSQDQSNGPSSPSIKKGAQKSNEVKILNNIKLKVPQGCIFGLLGPSSCGKTTLLRCLVGLLEPNSGSIKLFGRSMRGRVPGSRFLGYMPQDLGLYEDFTIRQLLTMFGQYTGMEVDLIETRIHFMVSFLDLPDVDRVINTLSGGQKRRVSFALACIHMPPLIILDEPTVGVDPLLRKSIWRYLRDLAQKQNTTIIITTHYIEEAAQADQVALMREGQILIQDAPKSIMVDYECKTLEEAFLKICNNVTSSGKTLNQVESKAKSNELESNGNIAIKQQQQQQQRNQLMVFEKNRGFFNRGKSKGGTLFFQQQEADNDNDEFDTESYHLSKSNDNMISSRALNNQPHHFEQKSTLKDRISARCSLIYALFYKNYRRNLNSIPLIVFQFMLPIIQMISFSLCVGGRPSQVGLGLVNHDSLVNYHTSLAANINGNFSIDSPTTTTMATPSLNLNDSTTPSDELLSQRYLTFIDPDVLDIHEYPSIELALRDVRRAKLWAAIEFGENFTSALLSRFEPDNFYQLERQQVLQSVIKLYPDKSNKILDMICMRILVNSFREFLSNEFDHLRQLPIQVKEVIFDIKPNLISNSLDGYTESIAAGLLASLTYIMAAGLTTFIMVVERGNGILERTFTSGVNPVLYLLAHAMFRTLVMMLQISLVMFLTFYLLEQPMVGSIWLAFFMLMTLNITGISYGLLVSSLVQDQNGAALTIVSSLVVKITMSGILWPLEAIPSWLRAACYAQPLTIPIQALRQITLKGASLEQHSVQLGFLVSAGWTCLFLFIAAKRFKFYQH